jgi:CubicO group peptidase (beta-lactamase class C family)
MMKISLLKLACTTALLISFIFPIYAQVARAETELQEIMTKLDVVGLSVAVVKNNEVVYTHSFGLKDRETNTPLSDTDVFRIASISKSFTATSIMQLVAAGKLSLDDDFSKLIGFKVRNPKFPETVITLQMVLSHRSSINDSQGYLNLDTINPEKNADWAKCYNDYEPGKGYQYCNLNYNMVGTVLEKVTGERFDQYVKKHVLDPLGLHAGYNVNMLDSKRFATLYEYDSVSRQFTPSPMAYAPRTAEIKNYVMGYSTPIFSPTGGMKMSTPDLAKYMIMHMNLGTYKGVKIMEKKYARQMQTKVSEPEGYGMAMMNFDDLIPGKRMTGHSGSAYGLYSAMFFQPKEKFGFVVITNGSNGKYRPEGEIREVYNLAIKVLYNNFIKK